MFKKLNKHYVSPIDQYLGKFDQTHTKTLSQLTEFNKYQQIYDWRDHAKVSKKPSADVWKDFLDSFE